MGGAPTPSRRRLRRLIPALLTALLVAVLAGAAPASAEDAPAQAPAATKRLVAKGEGTMKLDCVNLSTEAKKYADARGFCPKASIDDDGYSEVWGDCGQSFVAINDLGGGRADTEWGFFSILGTVAYRNLTVSWMNWEFMQPGSFLDKNWMASPVYYNNKVFTMGWGEVSVALSGTVRLAWGGTCTILVPDAWATLQ